MRGEGVGGGRGGASWLALGGVLLMTYSAEKGSI